MKDLYTHGCTDESVWETSRVCQCPCRTSKSNIALKKKHFNQELILRIRRYIKLTSQTLVPGRREDGTGIIDPRPKGPARSPPVDLHVHVPQGRIFRTLSLWERTTTNWNCYRSRRKKKIHFRREVRRRGSTVCWRSSWRSRRGSSRRRTGVPPDKCTSCSGCGRTGRRPPGPPAETEGREELENEQGFVIWGMRGKSERGTYLCNLERGWRSTRGWADTQKRSCSRRSSGSPTRRSDN